MLIWHSTSIKSHVHNRYNKKTVNTCSLLELFFLRIPRLIPSRFYNAVRRGRKMSWKGCKIPTTLQRNYMRHVVTVGKAWERGSTLP